ncbi:DUF1793-domain-containing protein [Saitoella complicata NRRL Y-17804]|uniref:DUF1793-domain-containing protein n=1 Tax=Saitoella complicata (strain BCRC 22490 / CBS 7301 / JCM 7358 / NBRC 10748 / NRRL Y-17804) TaxID=698492 RepID=UPI000867A6AC|nr:DUF1793-domain-containing protein [Saitoella complicata NRRL Y-17804]ODQ51653.1 DUF1793-domain-containing protein [Saitoella complicata NRRL Y-17804]
MLFVILFPALLLAISMIMAVGASGSQLKPPSLPLFVRTPYFSAWLPDARNEPWKNWPQFYTGDELGLTVMVRHDASDTVYPLVGRGHEDLFKEASDSLLRHPHYRGASYDASTTNLSYTLSMDNAADQWSSDTRVTLSFISPVTPDDTFRQAVPACYLAVHVEGTAELSIYIEFNGMWATGDPGGVLTWQVSKHDNTRIIDIGRQEERLFTETRDRAEWGRFYLIGNKTDSYEIGDARLLRQRFAQRGTLIQRTTTNSGTMDVLGTVMAVTHHFEPTSDGVPLQRTAHFSVAHVQIPTVQFARARGVQAMKPLWQSNFTAGVFQMLHFHYNDFASSVGLAKSFSNTIKERAVELASDTYADILALSARQVLGATSFAGTPEEPLLFLKEISSNGNHQTVDVIYPAMPFFLYANPAWLRYALVPLLEHQAAGLYPRDAAMHDLGTHFPNATGHPDGNDEQMPLEECGNMLIMTLAMLQSFRQHQGVEELRSWLEGSEEQFGELGAPIGTSAQHRMTRYALLNRWAEYLVDNTLFPSHQLSTDDFAGPLENQTNLALKGIIGINAMSELAAILGRSVDSRYYAMIAELYIHRWEKLAMTDQCAHAKLAYHWQGSWCTLYNLFADSLLFPSEPLVPERVYHAQSDWYEHVLQTYGLPLDNRHLYAKSDWEFVALSTAGRTLKLDIINRIGHWINETSTDRPLTDLYDTEPPGGFSGAIFYARPVVGAHFALLALEKVCHSK